jgi:hypothetical protein
MSFGFGFALPAYPLRGGGGNNPFNQDGATLDLSFIGTAGDLSGADTYTLNTDFITPEYQVAAQYAVWENGVGLAQKTFAQIVTFTRASTGTYFNSAGTLTSAAVDEARFDYNPSTLAPLGFLIEESRTNSIRNNTMVGAVAGTPGTLPTNWTVFTPLTGLTQQVVGTGTESGITYLDFRLSGTPSAAGTFLVFFESGTNVTASNGQVWNSSSYAKLAGGSLSGVTSFELVVTERSAGAELARSSQAFTPTSAGLNTQRVNVTRTNNNVATLYELSFVQFNLSGAAIDITLRIGLPQLELGAFATSVIPTTTTALTRSQDRAVVNTLAPWYNSVAGTIYAEFAVTQPSSGANQFLAKVSDNSYNNQIGDFISTTGFAAISTASGGVFDGLASTAIVVSANTVAKFAGAYAANNLAACKDGGTVATDATATIPSGMTRFDLGSDHAGFNSVKAGYLRRITYYPRRLTNADLQAITT